MSLLLATETNLFFLFSFSLVLTCPFFPLTFSSGSSLQLCYLRVIHPLFSPLSKSHCASWAANSKEVVAAQQSLGRAEQRHQDCKDAACNNLWPASLRQAWEQEWKGSQFFPRDHPWLSLHLSKYTITLIIKSFGVTHFPSFCFPSGSISSSYLIWIYPLHFK